MRIRTVPLSKIQPYTRELRERGDVVEKLVESLRAFGWRQPLVVDEHMVIVVGQARFEAAKALDLESAPVHVASDLSESELRAYRLMDNRSREDGRWEPDALRVELGDLEREGLPLSLTGFEDSELQEMLGHELFVGLEEDDAAPAIDRGSAIARAGDAWLLGPHRLVCGDATEIATVRQLMREDKKPAAMAFTDPPYNVDVQGKAGSIQNDKMTDGAFRELLRRSLSNLASCLAAGAPCYVAHSETEGLNFRRAFEGAGFHTSSCLIWKKDSATLGRGDYQWQHEPILYGWKKGHAHRWYGGRAQTTILEFDRPKRSDEHPTMKPVDLLAALLVNSSLEGDLVVDVFGGSGSTLIAAHRERRISRIVEIEPAFCDVIIRRWQAYTGDRATREGDGARFDDLEPQLVEAA